MTWHPRPPAAHEEKSVPREGECLASAVMAAFAVTLLLPGSTFSRPVFVNIASVAPEDTWGMGLLIMAAVRMIGLWINGNWRQSPTLRFLGAAVAACIWASLARLFSDDGYPGWNTGVAVYAAIAPFDLIAAVRSLREQGRNDQRAAVAVHASRETA